MSVADRHNADIQGNTGNPLKLPRIALIWAMDRNRVIGNKNGLPWHLPVDMRHFRALTTGHPILMGRKTFESLGRPLPNRTNIVISAGLDSAPAGCLLANSAMQAVHMASPHMSPGDPKIFVIGGQSLYTQMLPLADQLYVTQVDAEVEGDAWFPSFDLESWRVTKRELCPADAKNAYSCTFLALEKKTDAP